MTFDRNKYRNIPQHPRNLKLFQAVYLDGVSEGCVMIISIAEQRLSARQSSTNDILKKCHIELLGILVRFAIRARICYCMHTALRKHRPTRL